MKTFDPETKDLNVVFETPRGSRNKYDYDPELGAFKLAHVLAYNERRGKKFKPLGRFGPKRALKLVKLSMKNFKKNGR